MAKTKKISQLDLDKEFSYPEAQEYLKKHKKKQGYFYYNVFGWSKYFTLKRTFATPSGKKKGFPSKVLIKV